MPASPRFALAAAACAAAIGLGACAEGRPAHAAWPDPAAPVDVVALPLPYAGPTGGWSGIDVSDDGTRFWAVTDAGRLAQGRLLREGGRLAGIEGGAPRALPLPPDVGRTDSEGIDVSHGEMWISVEGVNRIYRLPEGGRMTPAPVPPLSAERLGNTGLEALARDAQGRLYTLPERPPARYGPFPVYPLLRFDPERRDWEIVASLAHDPEWLATGADFGPDGALYLLERRFGGIAFSSRIRRFEPFRGEAGLRGHLVYLSAFGTHGNLEGLAIWRDEAGALRAVMVADDNHKAYQRSEIVEVTLPPLASEAGGQ
jgi:hypothetical protein